MIYDYNFTTKIIGIPFGVDAVNIIDLISDIRDAEATAIGIRYGQIATASGNESLGGSVSVGVTVYLLDDWQIQFASGNYIAKVSGGNLVGGYAGTDPIAYSAGVQVLLVQSAASTVVVEGGSVLTASEIAKAVWGFERV